MTCAHTRGRTPCAPVLPPIDPDIGQTVRLKSEPEKTYVVTAVICERTTPLGEDPIRLTQRFRVCCTQGFSRNVHEVGLCELEAPAVPTLADNDPVDAMLDANELPIAAEEDVLDFLVAPTVEQATVEFAPPTPPEQVFTVVETPQLRWNLAGAGFESACGRFNIQSQFRNGVRSYFAIDQQSNTADLRFSPDSSEDEAKSWCERRARFRVIFADGEEQLATLEDLHGIEF
jgi:hypothetical protein